MNMTATITLDNRQIVLSKQAKKVYNPYYCKYPFKKFPFKQGFWKLK